MEKKNPEPPVDPFAARLPQLLRLRLQIVAGVCENLLDRLWHPDLRLQPLVREVETITDLSAGFIFALERHHDDQAWLSREALCRPSRFHAMLALCRALTESPLRDSPLVMADVGEEPTNPNSFWNISDDLLHRLECGPPQADGTWPDPEDRVVIDYLPGHEPTAQPAPGNEAAAETAAVDNDEPEEQDDDDDDDDTEGAEEEGPDAAGRLISTGAALRLRRLRLDNLIRRAAATLADVVAGDLIFVHTDPIPPDEADADPDQAEYYHNRWLHLQPGSGARNSLQMALLLASYWYLDPAVPFARAAAQLRWLRRRTAVAALFARLQEVPEGEEWDLSLAEALTIYQAFQSVVLAGLHDVFSQTQQAWQLRRDRDALRLQLGFAEPDDADDPEEEAADHWPHAFFSADYEVTAPFYHAATKLAEVLEKYFNDPDTAAELAQAKAEIAALAEQFAA